MPLCHLKDRAIVRLSGEDVRDFLQGLLTQDVNALAADNPLYAGLLSPQGKALFQLFLFADGADVLLDVDAGACDSLVKRLMMFRLRKKVAIEKAPELAVFQCWGVECRHPADPRTPLAGSRFVAAAGSEHADAELSDWHAHRVVLGLPDADEIGSDELLWLETNARELNGVSFTKGCYTGQENTARMHHRDKLRKRLLPVRLAPEAPADAPLMAGDREAGYWRGSRYGDVQMALFRNDYLGAELRVGESRAELILPPWLIVAAD